MAEESSPPVTESTKPEAAAAKKTAEDEPEEAARPEPDPETCKAVALCLPHFEASVLEGEWDDTEFRFYLEPAGVMQARLVCERCAPDASERAGLFMTRTGWQAHIVFLSDGLNPETYELSFPKEFGYVKTLSHYQPESREHAKYPWTKKY